MQIKYIFEKSYPNFDSIKAKAIRVTDIDKDKKIESV